MIYIILDIFYFKQLKKIDNKLEDLILNSFNINNFRKLLQSGNSIIFSIGNKNTLNPAQLLKIINNLNNTLSNLKDKLHGYNILIQELNSNNINQIKDELYTNIINFDEDECIWIDDSINDILINFIETEYKYSFRKIIKINQIIKESEPYSDSKWIRIDLYNKITFHIGKCLNLNRTGLILIGQNNIAIKDTVYSSVLNIVNKDYISYVPILFTLFNRQSPVHPFLNSINFDFFIRVPEFLNNYEKLIWDNNSNIINYLLDNSIQNKCYDNFVKDFYIIFNLYISAYMKMMKLNNLPSFIIIDNLDSYHIESVKLLLVLFNDFYNNPDFIPILISNDDRILKYFKKYNFSIINAGITGWKEVRNLAEFIFPGINLPRNVCKIIVKNTDGNIIYIKQFLYFLIKQNKVKKENNIFYFAKLKEKKVNYKKDHKKIIFYLVKEFSNHQKEILYIICLLSGIFKLKTFYIFLNYLDYSETIIEESINLFLKYHLINISSTIISNFNFLKTTLEHIHVDDKNIIKDKVFNFILKEWNDNNFSHLVLLFYFFIRNNYYDSASDILPSLLNRKFDEMDFNNILPFLDSFKKTIANIKKESIKRIFELTILSAYLRYYNYKKDFEKAYNLVKKIENKIDIYNHSREKGNLLLRISSFYYYSGNINKAIIILKKSLLEIQDYGTNQDKARIYLNMGCYFFSDGKIDESLEYLNFSENLLDFECFEKLRCLSLKCSIFFITNKLSKIPDILHICLKMSNSIGKREWETYIYFLCGRFEFQLGNYNKSSAYFQKGINLTILYSNTNAYNLFLRWFCRSEIYNGNIHKSITILEKLDKHNETLFFISEGYHFLGSNDKALFCLNKASKNKIIITPELNEKLVWENGFSIFEGFCFKLEKEISILDTFIIYFRSYILSLTGHVNESLEELQFITGKSISIIDLYKHIYYLFYYLSLPKYRDSKDNSVNRFTLLNKATAVLHDISNRIDSTSHRADFLYKNYWNSILYNEAKNQNLV